MSRLIDADELKTKMIPLSFSVQKWVSETDIAYCKTIEAEPIRHGHWIEPDEHDIGTACTCSVCNWSGHIMEDDVMGMPYCPNCGARMDEEKE